MEILFPWAVDLCVGKFMTLKVSLYLPCYGGFISMGCRFIYCVSSAVFLKMLWHIDPLLGNDHETNKETMAVARQRPTHSNGSTVGSGGPLPGSIT
jgi:hypothetical protein